MNSLDKNIKRKLKERTIQPSVSAWDRMSSQLDAVEKKKSRKLFWFAGYAASILLIVSAFFYFMKDNNESDLIPEDVFVNGKIDTVKLKPIEKLMIPEIKEVVVSNQIEPVKRKKITKKLISPNTSEIKNPEFTAEKRVLDIKVKDSEKEDSKLLDSKPNTIEKEIKSIIKPEKPSNNSIIVNSDALLYAVTHNPEEVKNFYKKYLIARQDALKMVKDELNKTKLEIDPETILAEVEMNLMEDNFQNNFFKNLKNRVSEVITFISTRND